MKIKKTILSAAISASFAAVIFYSPTNLATTPTLNLFPTSVVENLQASADSAKEMEDSMEGIVAQMDNQLQLYKESKCEASDADAGCTQIKKGINTTYMSMLDKMQAQLPTMKRAMQSTAKTLGKNIRTELGRKMTVLDLQRLIQGKKGGVKNIRKISGRRQGRMSGMLSQYHKMISLSSHKTQTQAILAAEIYADATETLDYINLIQMEIDQSKVMGGLSTLWNGEPSEQMVSTVLSVKTMLFGDVEGDVIPEMLAAPIDPALDDSDWVIE